VQLQKKIILTDGTTAAILKNILATIKKISFKKVSQQKKIEYIYTKHRGSKSDTDSWWFLCK
jgi:hypothetical protein